MNPESRATSGNQTLSEEVLATCRPIGGEGGRVLRAFCPFHGSDQQRSLRVRLDTGHFSCFACGAWGYTETTRRRWQKVHSQDHLRRVPPRHQRQSTATLPFTTAAPVRPPTAFTPPLDLAQPLAAFQAALPNSRGATYLSQRQIPLTLAQHAGVGYAAPGTWPHPVRDWRGGRVVFPHTTPTGDVVNLYGRAVGQSSTVPKAMRHDHLPGAKGYFNAAALQRDDGPLFVCEGVFDALSLMAAGYLRVVAIFGVQGWRWEWAHAVRELVFALDADTAGQQHWRALARQAVLRGKRVAVLPPDAYGGHKDVNDAWAAGMLRVGDWPSVTKNAWAEPQRELWEERVALMEYDGGLVRVAAEQAAWRCITPRTRGT